MNNTMVLIVICYCITCRLPREITRSLFKEKESITILIQHLKRDHFKIWKTTKKMLIMKKR